VISVPNAVIIGGLTIGIVFGVVGLLSGFCLTTGLRHWWTARDGRAIRTFALALTVALVGTQSLVAAHLVDTGQSLYLQPSFSIPLMLCGGMLFGYGMVAANACVSRALVLLGCGNVRSLVVITTVAVTAEATLRGLLAPLRLTLLSWSQTKSSIISLPELVTAFGLDASVARALTVAIAAILLLSFSLGHARFRRSIGQLAAGVIVGLLVPAGWLVTGYWGADPFEPAPVASLTFVAPTADTLQYVMFSTGSVLNFGIALVAGVLVGSFVTALLSGRFELVGFDSVRHMLRSIGGAALMGIGGALALGCSIGQGLTGLSTLSIASLVAATGIMLGAAAALVSPARVPAAARA